MEKTSFVQVDFNKFPFSCSLYCILLLKILEVQNGFVQLEDYNINKIDCVVDNTSLIWTALNLYKDVVDMLLEGDNINLDKLELDNCS